jgi:hypothetical protein
MAYQNGPKIVTNGLVLCLDAGNPKSYPGSGTAWTDLIGNNRNITLVNGPTASKDGITLDGTNDYAYIFHGGSLQFSSGSYTISVWHRNNTSSTGYNGIITNDNSGDNSWKIFRDQGEGYYKARSGTYFAAFPSYTVNRFHHYAYTFDGSSTMILYFDGNFVSSNTGGQPSSNNEYMTFGSYRYNSILQLLYLENQTIGPVALYNKALTRNEILQNYNATKGRFKL